MQKEERKEYHRLWRLNNKDKLQVYKERHTPSLSDKNKRDLALLRAIVLEKLGGKCLVCGWDDYRALQIDHINGGGSAERKKYGSSIPFLLKVLNDPNFIDTYQLLCANHNWVKRYENKEI